MTQHLIVNCNFLYCTCGSKDFNIKISKYPRGTPVKCAKCERLIGLLGKENLKN